MIVRIASAAMAGMLAFAGVAAANHQGAKSYRAKLAPVVAGTTAPTGKAHLVDGKKRDVVTVKVKGLTAGTSYPWHVHVLPAGVTDPCAPGAAQGPIDTRFTYGTLTGNAAGNGRAKGRSTTFVWGTASYYVNVHDPATGAPIACGVLTRKAPHGHGHAK